MHSPTLLCILDGVGLNPNPRANAFAQANKPNISKLLASSPNATLVTHGTRVGLPAGHMGNSEVGHLNIGAGRVVEQWLVRISRELAQGALDHSADFQSLLKNLPPTATLHLVGLVSAGGVHSQVDHLYLLLESLSKYKIGRIALHIITDGRDTAPDNGLRVIQELEGKIRSYSNCCIASICGRFYAMDRDKRWERTQKFYDAVMLGKASHSNSASEWMQACYEQEIFDEFLEPAVVNPVAVGSSDAFLFFNFRADRMRQIVSALFRPDFNGFLRASPPVSPKRILTFTEYDASFPIPFLFSPVEIKNHLGEVVSKAQIKQLRTAETEKYPHVTYFFNGGNEEPFANEERTLIPSPRDVRTYDLKPEMSARQVCDVVVNALESKQFGLVVVNFANGDMVGHTGVLSAGIKAVEVVDECLGKIIPVLDKLSGQALIIADHGNCEQMENYETGAPHTAHTTYPVPV
ncbi:MAG: 2,3-bisphosphoglycerate-independent phosphoglycerate mutase, partial [Bdellovibrionales bacterium]|nr:2,3-bisphosphoglycerate-independent phosphoglycerate mutase [Bdellovibrionales bacterium]